MTDIIAEATEIVAGMEREELLTRIATLLKTYPNGVAVFAISDDAPQYTGLVNITGNSQAPFLDWLLWLSRHNLHMAEWEQREQQAPDDGDGNGP